MADTPRVQTSGCSRARSELHPLNVKPISRPVYGKFWFKVKSHPHGYGSLYGWLAKTYGVKMVDTPHKCEEQPVMKWRGGRRLSAYFDSEERLYECALGNLKHIELVEVPYNQKQVDMWDKDNTLTLLQKPFRGKYGYKFEYLSNGITHERPMRDVVDQLHIAGYQCHVDYDYFIGWSGDVLYVLDRDIATFVKLMDVASVRLREKALTYSEVEILDG